MRFLESFGVDLNVGFFLLSCIMLVAGHAIRVRRWNLLLPDELSNTSSPQFSALSLGYLIDFFAPFRIGEVVRICSFSYLGRRDLAGSAASVIIERSTDVIVVVLLLLVFQGTLTTSGQIITQFMAALGLLGFAYGIMRVRLVRRICGVLAAPFIEKIRFGVFHTLWTLGETYCRLVRQATSYAVHTVIMWCFYVLAYWLLAYSLNLGFPKLFNVVFGNFSEPAVVNIGRNSSPELMLVIFVFMLVPLASIMIYVFGVKRYTVKLRGITQWFSDSKFFFSPNGTRRRHFQQPAEYAAFLERSFVGAPRLIDDFFAFAVHDNAVLHRIFHGGSDALTALVQTGETLRVRKFASTGGVQKLQDQHHWLCEYRSTLPLVSVAGKDSRMLPRAATFMYDMPYSSKSRDFFNVIHTSSDEYNWHMLKSVLDTMRRFHESHPTGTATDSVVLRYIEEKVRKNLDTLVESAPLLCQSDALTINGQTVNISKVVSFFHGKDLISRFGDRRICAIHGDLTIENILIDDGFPDGWFLIDPNVGNVFESPLIDFAKLLQSLHLGYESLNRGVQCEFDEGNLLIPFHRTSKYAALHRKYNEWLKAEFGVEVYRQIRLHEIVNYLRLTPYKYRNQSASGLAFAGCTILLANQYIEEFEVC